MAQATWRPERAPARPRAKRKRRRRKRRSFRYKRTGDALANFVVGPERRGLAAASHQTGDTNDDDLGRRPEGPARNRLVRIIALLAVWFGTSKWSCWSADAPSSSSSSIALDVSLTCAPSKKGLRPGHSNRTSNLKIVHIYSNHERRPIFSKIVVPYSLPPLPLSDKVLVSHKQHPDQSSRPLQCYNVQERTVASRDRTRDNQDIATELREVERVLPSTCSIVVVVLGALALDSPSSYAAHELCDSLARQRAAAPRTGPANGFKIFIQVAPDWRRHQPNDSQIVCARSKLSSGSLGSLNFGLNEREKVARMKMIRRMTRILVIIINETMVRRDNDDWQQREGRRRGRRRSAQVDGKLMIVLAESELSKHRARSLANGFGRPTGNLGRGQTLRPPIIRLLVASRRAPTRLSGRRRRGADKIGGAQVADAPGGGGASRNSSLRLEPGKRFLELITPVELTPLLPLRPHLSAVAATSSLESANLGADHSGETLTQLEAQAEWASLGLIEASAARNRQQAAQCKQRTGTFKVDADEANLFVSCCKPNLKLKTKLKKQANSACRRAAVREMHRLAPRPRQPRWPIINQSVTLAPVRVELVTLSARTGYLLSCIRAMAIELQELSSLVFAMTSNRNSDCKSEQSDLIGRLRLSSRLASTQTTATTTATTTFRADNETRRERPTPPLHTIIGHWPSSSNSARRRRRCRRRCRVNNRVTKCQIGTPTMQMGGRPATIGVWPTRRARSQCLLLLPLVSALVGARPTGKRRPLMAATQSRQNSWLAGSNDLGARQRRRRQQQQQRPSPNQSGRVVACRVVVAPLAGGVVDSVRSAGNKSSSEASNGRAHDNICPLVLAMLHNDGCARETQVGGRELDDTRACKLIKPSAGAREGQSSAESVHNNEPRLAATGRLSTRSGDSSSNNKGRQRRDILSRLGGLACCCCCCFYRLVVGLLRPDALRAPAPAFYCSSGSTTAVLRENFLPRAEPQEHRTSSERVGCNENGNELVAGRRPRVRHDGEHEGATKCSARARRKLTSGATLLLVLIAALVACARVPRQASAAGHDDDRLATSRDNDHNNSNNNNNKRLWQSIMLAADAANSSQLDLFDAAAAAAAEWPVGTSLQAAAIRADFASSGGLVNERNRTRNRGPIERSKVVVFGARRNGRQVGRNPMKTARANLIAANTAKHEAKQQFRLLQTKQESGARIDKINLKQRARAASASDKTSKSHRARAIESPPPLLPPPAGRAGKKWPRDTTTTTTMIRNHFGRNRRRLHSLGQGRLLSPTREGNNNNTSGGNFAHVIRAAAGRHTRRRRRQSDSGQSTAIDGPRPALAGSRRAPNEPALERRRPDASPADSGHEAKRARAETRRPTRHSKRSPVPRENRHSVQLHEPTSAAVAQTMRQRQTMMMTMPRKQPMVQLAGANALNSSRGVECPQAWCQCTWKNGKQFADCSGANNARRTTTSESLKVIPNGLDPLLQVLNMSANQLDELPAAAFNSLRLNNLQRIYLQSCHLSRIHSRAFENLKLVVELDFAWNQLASIPLMQMRHLTLLRRLSMRGNPLRALDEENMQGGVLARGRANSPSQAPEVAQHLSAGLTRADLTRLYETYPELSISLSRQPLSGVEEEGDEPDRGQVELLSSIINELSRPGASGNHQHDPSDDDQSNELGEPEVQANQLDLGPEVTDDDATRALRRSGWSLGHFEHLQELDLGECRLSYIKWTTLSNLRSLKRLQLDGNHLSQLSGLLVNHLPSSLFELSLEGNPWQCDCRLRDLRLWLMRTRTPLSAPVACHESSWPAATSNELDRLLQTTTSSGDRVARRRKAPVSGQVDRFGDGAGQTPATTKGQTLAVFLDQMGADEFVCAPRASRRLGQLRAGQRQSTGGGGGLLSRVLGAFDNGPRAASQGQEIRDGTAALGGGGGGQENQISNLLLQSDAASSGRLKISQLFEYLKPTLVDEGGRQQQQTPRAVSTVSNGKQGARQNDILLVSSASSEQKQPPLARLPEEHLQALEDDKVTMRCAFYAYPSSSVDILWLADYSAGPKQRPIANRINHQAAAVATSNNNNREANHNHWTSDANKGAFVLLYDSRLHASSVAAANNSSPQKPHTSEGKTTNGVNKIDEEFSELESMNSMGPIWDEVSLYDSRLVVRETQSYTPAERTPSGSEPAAGIHYDGSSQILKESQMIIRSVRLEDSARYKCVALNGAGSDGLEFSLRVTTGGGDYVSPGGQIPRGDGQLARGTGSAGRQRGKNQVSSQADGDSGGSNEDGQTRDQRANGSSSSWSSSWSSSSEQPPARAFAQTTQRQQQQQGPPTGGFTTATNRGRKGQAGGGQAFASPSATSSSSGESQVTSASTTASSGSHAQQQQQSGANWFKSSSVSASFQIVLIVVSVLMGAVILAFLLVCIIIYQIKPTPVPAAAGESCEQNQPVASLLVHDHQHHQQRASIMQQHNTHAGELVDQQTNTHRLLVANPVHLMFQPEPATVANGHQFGYATLGRHANSADFHSQSVGPQGQQHMFNQAALDQQQQQQQSQRHLTAVCDPKTGRAQQSRLEWTTPGRIEPALSGFAAAAGLTSTGGTTNQSMSTPPIEQASTPTGASSGSISGGSMDAGSRQAMAVYNQAGLPGAGYFGAQVPPGAIPDANARVRVVSPGKQQFDVFGQNPRHNNNNNNDNTQEACL